MLNQNCIHMGHLIKTVQVIFVLNLIFKMMLLMEIQNYSLKNRNFRIKKVVDLMFLFRVSLFQLEKQRAEGLIPIVTMLQAVCI